MAQNNLQQDISAVPAPLPPTAEETAKKKKTGAFWSLLDFVSSGRFFTEDVLPEEIQADESAFLVKRHRLLKLIRRQTYVIAALVLLVLMVMPYLRPYYTYWARSSGASAKNVQLLPMDEPNMTDKAVLSWVEASITEIMTFGFGDFDRRILSQKHRFTSVGWESFLESIRQQDLRSNFKLRQLVLTTAPADAPVIVSKGLDEDLDYVWTIEMPIVMTYTTNNNVRSERRTIVSIKVSRVPSTDSVRGIGIKMWRMF